MSDQVKSQYEAFPYPERDPKDEKKRLITGSPSHPLEMDHFLWAGQRDWSAPIKILVAGGGTGDALIQLAQTLTNARKKYEITYIDLSTASRAIAEKRAKARNLKRIEFVTGSLLDAPEMGEFDYIDCCGVLHHLPEPQEGFNALSQALKPDGGIGLMVYAPYGRSGVYPLQEAFNALYSDLSPEDRLKAASQVFNRLPPTHQFKTNPHVGDHKTGPAGFYDLLLHSTDQPFTIKALRATLEVAGLQMTGTPHALQYDLSRFLGQVPRELDEAEQMAIAEKLDGTIKHHVIYARRKDGSAPGRASGTDTDIPHLRGIKPGVLAQNVAQKQEISITLFGTPFKIPVPKEAAPIIAAIDGRTDIATLRRTTDPILWPKLWPGLEQELLRFGLMVYSHLLR